MKNIQSIHANAFQQEGIGKRQSYEINKEDYKFLFGDLNFRLD